MPNWCYQTMTVAGNRTQLRRFVKEITVTKDKSEPAHPLDEDYSLNHLVPLDPRASVGDRFADMERDGFDGYNHALERWGTKWGACRPEIISGKGEYPLVIRFESAWSPATPLIQNISSQYPGLGFATTYYEESWSYAGWTLVHDGEVLCNEFGDTENMPAPLEEMWRNLHNAEIEANDNEEETYELAEEYEEKRDEWLETVYDGLHKEALEILDELLVWRKKAERQRKAGRFVESFMPSV